MWHINILTSLIHSIAIIVLAVTIYTTAEHLKHRVAALEQVCPPTRMSALR